MSRTFPDTWKSRAALGISPASYPRCLGPRCGRRQNATAHHRNGTRSQTDPHRERPHFVQWSQIRAARRSVTRVLREGFPRSLPVALAPRRARALDRQIALLNGQWIPVRSLLCESCVYLCAGAWPSVCFHGAACRPQAVHDNAQFYLSSNGHAMSALSPIADMCGATSACPLSANSGHRQFYWITSSARAINAGGTVRPSALAVLRLMASSNFVGNSTGRSPGFSPLRIRAT